MRRSAGEREPPDDRHGLRALLSSGAKPRRPVRWLVLHRGHVDGHLLPPELPGDDAEGRNVRFYPTAAAAAGSRVPRLPALPARRHPRLAGVERARRPRRPRDAADRRRRGRPRGRRGARSPARLQRAAPEPAAHRRGRRRAARARPGTAGADRARAHRDDRAALRRRRVRGRLREHPAVQRHDPRGLRDDAQRAAHCSHAAVDLAPPGVIVLRLPVPRAVRRRRGGGVPRRARSARHRRGGGHDLPAHAAAGPRCGRG